MSFSGTIIFRGESGFREVLNDIVWNAMKPEREPAVIVRPQSAADVADAVKLAAEKGLQIKARSGGHSWTASCVRQDSMLIDLGEINDITVDRESSTAVIGTGAKVKQVVGTLADNDLFFPAGHCPSVGIGGFLLQGGWGWNSRALGVACTNVRAVDVVTADGRLIHANATENPEYYWGARGAGSGYFGIVTHFHVSCFTQPKCLLHRQEIYPEECGEEIMKWSFGLQEQLPNEVEWFVFCSRPSPTEKAQYRVEAISFLSDESTGRQALEIFDSCPVRHKAISSSPTAITDMATLLAGTDGLYLEGYRWAGDNAWFDQGSDDLAAAIVEAANVLPPWPSHLVVYGWPSPLPFQDSLFSMAGKIYACAISGWNDPKQDSTGRSASMRSISMLEPFAKGMGLADEGLLYRDAPVHSIKNAEQLERIRKKVDPENRFLSYLTKGGK
ncbi:FAD-binding oxidoreductase [Pectobacterium sp. A5351]|uniref:FAD-binding oxidoreductase n=1 Tax=Pectobacterium sp. A5351 TaxID=2914983 RepID=UPI00232AD2EC|nr:FAD-binding oxidoreductase [Pectobacterium sp. A5351]WCG82570.1 FAD-binding oxidoreductase [Pectobacterium sp. A5351]